MPISDEELRRATSETMAHMQMPIKMKFDGQPKKLRFYMIEVPRNITVADVKLRMEALYWQDEADCGDRSEIRRDLFTIWHAGECLDDDATRLVDCGWTPPTGAVDALSQFRLTCRVKEPAGSRLPDAPDGQRWPRDEREARNTLARSLMAMRVEELRALAAGRDVDLSQETEKSAMINIILVAANKDMANLVRASTMYVVTTDNLLAERAKTGTLTRKMVRPAIIADNEGKFTDEWLKAEFKDSIKAGIREAASCLRAMARRTCDVCARQGSLNEEALPLCDGCGERRYCSVECQRVDWVLHGHAEACPWCPEMPLSVKLGRPV